MTARMRRVRRLIARALRGRAKPQLFYPRYPGTAGNSVRLYPQRNANGSIEITLGARNGEEYPPAESALAPRFYHPSTLADMRAFLGLKTPERNAEGRPPDFRELANDAANRPRDPNCPRDTVYLFSGALTAFSGVNREPTR